MSTETSIYGMSPEEYAEFIAYIADNFPHESSDIAVDRARGHAWAACAKLNRERAHDLNEQHTTEYCKARAMERLADKRALRIEELETEVERLRAAHLGEWGRAAAAKREVEWLRVDAAGNFIELAPALNAVADSPDPK